MKRFRKWLIHKLGGITEDDVIPKIPTLYTERKKIQKLCSQTMISKFNFKNANPEAYKKLVFLDLKNKLADEVDKYTEHNVIDLGEVVKFTSTIEIVVGE